MIVMKETCPKDFYGDLDDGEKLELYELLLNDEGFLTLLRRLGADCPCGAGIPASGDRL